MGCVPWLSLDPEKEASNGVLSSVQAGCMLGLCQQLVTVTFLAGRISGLCVFSIFLNKDPREKAVARCASI